MSDISIQPQIQSKLTHLKKRISGRLQQGLYAELRRYGLHRDLTRPLENPKAKIPISVRPLMELDIDVLLPLEGVSAAERQEAIWRRDFYRRLPKGCFVAVDLRDGKPCYMQWLVGPGDNDILARFKCFPPLKNGEALLEQAYTPPSHRGLGVMSAAMAMIAERASDLGARHVLTFVEEKNTASLKGCWRAGFQPYLRHRRTQMGFGIIVRNSFREMAENDPKRTLIF